MLARPCRPEAIHMDAQQRLLLDRSWEVLQAGHQLDASSAGATAVFVGIGTVEYTAMASHLGIGIYMATGQPRHPLHQLTTFNFYLQKKQFYCGLGFIR